MRHSESLGKLAAALVQAQGEIEHAHKNAVNPHFRNEYANLAEVLNTTRPVLNKYGLSVVQLPGFEAGVVTLDTVLLHTSGEWLAGTGGSPATKQDPQGVGSAITYLRRYSLAALCGIAQEDDDGHAASRNGNARAATVQTVTAKQAATLDDLIEEAGVERGKFLAHYGLAKVSDLPASRYDEAVGLIEKKRATVGV